MQLEPLGDFGVILKSTGAQWCAEIQPSWIYHQTKSTLMEPNQHA